MQLTSHYESWIIPVTLRALCRAMNPHLTNAVITWVMVLQLRMAVEPVMNHNENNKHSLFFKRHLLRDPHMQQHNKINLAEPKQGLEKQIEFVNGRVQFNVCASVFECHVFRAPLWEMLGMGWFVEVLCIVCYQEGSVCCTHCHSGSNGNSLWEFAIMGQRKVSLPCRWENSLSAFWNGAEKCEKREKSALDLSRGMGLRYDDEG